MLNTQNKFIATNAGKNVRRALSRLRVDRRWALLLRFILVLTGKCNRTFYLRRERDMDARIDPFRSKRRIFDLTGLENGLTWVELSA